MKTTKNDHYLTGKLLIAMPNMGDDRFERAVIFVCSHDEEGAMGLVINNKMAGIEFTDLVSQLKIESDIKVDFERLNLPVLSGGPVDSARGFLLHSSDFHRDDTMKVDTHYGITGTVEALKDIARGKGPGDLLFILGYAGWTAGQLDAELQQNAWLVVDSDPDLIFNGPLEKKWSRAVTKLGVNPAMLSCMTGNA